MPDTAVLPPKRRPMRLLIAVAVLLALAGGWWLSRPPAFRFVGMIVLPPHVTNFAIRESHILITTVNTAGGPHWEGWARPATVQCLDEGGRVRWTITVPAADSGVGTLLSPNIVTVPQDIRQIIFSPDGRLVAAVMPIGAEVCVITWRDGKKLGYVCIPAARFGSAAYSLKLGAQLTDDGRVLLYVKNTARSPLLLIQGRRIIATGEHRSPFRAAAESPLRSIAPDLRGMTYGEERIIRGRQQFHLASGTMAIHDGVITVRQRVLGTFDREIFSQLSNGQVVLVDGTCLDASGTRVGTAAMSVPISTDWPLPIAAPTMTAHRTGARLRLHSLTGGGDWSLPPRMEVARPIVSDRYALAYYPPGDGAPHRRLKALAARIPFLRDQARAIGIPRPLYLFERPGRIRATLPMVIAFPPDADHGGPSTLRCKVGQVWYTVDRMIFAESPDRMIFAESPRRLWLTATLVSGGAPTLLAFTWR
ncbi:MAG TPA: hypothetical protein PLZ36_02915 [Armatimonadota bacterium]|nr:hypothetical protein [Armatimonadota bacterium]HOS42638.1 hypothetical protein [Armatimonadota bacterium]